MTKGILLYCFNTPTCDYHLILEKCVALIKKNLKLEITVVTNLQTFKKIKHLGMINFKLIDNATTNSRGAEKWFNLERCTAYEMSPYDRTILMDIDYFCYTDNLLDLVNSKDEFLIHDKVHDVTGRDSYNFERESMIPILWATVIVFSKTDSVKNIFKFVEYVKSNYQYFCDIYRLGFRNFRNDYAFSIAINQTSGHKLPKFLPTKMATLPSRAKIIAFDLDNLIYEFQDMIGVVENQDVHVLDKGVAHV